MSLFSVIHTAYGIGVSAGDQGNLQRQFPYHSVYLHSPCPPNSPDQEFKKETKIKMM